MRIALGAGGSGLGGVRFNQRVVDGLKAEMGDDLDVIRVGSLRSKADDATRRLPMSAFDRRSLRTMRAFGAAYWGGAPLHRMDIRLPPARNEIVTVLDFAPLHFDDEGTIPDWVIPSIRRSKGALCLSPTVAEEVQQIADIPTWITGAGVDQRFIDAEPLDESTLASIGITGPFVLSAGGTTKRKNLQLLVDCWPMVRREASLTLVSVGPNAEQRRRMFAGVPGVSVIDEVDDIELPGLLSAADLLVVPSLYEGFGMPVIEAMATATPVVAADASSLPWVAGGAALLAEPESSTFADAILRVHYDSHLRNRLLDFAEAEVQRHGWSNVVQSYLEAYREVGTW